MKISCTKENLYQALSITSHLAGKNVNLPVLQNVLIKAEAGTIRFTTTNLEMAVHGSVRGKVEEAGEVTIPSKLFFDFVSLLPNENVHLETEGEHLRLSCGNFETTINGLPAAEFPLIPSVKSEWGFSIPSEAFRSALSRVLFAVATNESRPELTGVCVRINDSQKGTILTLAATDSYRLAEESILLDGKPEGQVREAILPSRALAEVARILSVFRDDTDAPASVQIQLSNNQAVFRLGSFELISRIVEGAYPDYRQIIPNQFETHMEADREDMAKAVKAASLFSKNGLYDIGLHLDAEKSELSVKATDATRGKNTANCTAQINGKANDVTVNYRYVLDGLNAVEGEKVVFEMIDASNPCLIRPKDSELGYLYLVMPIKQ